jgi:hypothetical protein
MQLVTDKLFEFKRDYKNGNSYIFIYPHDTIQEALDKNEKFFQESEIVENGSLWYNEENNSYRVVYRSDTVVYYSERGFPEVMTEEKLKEKGFLYNPKDFYDETELYWVWWKPWNAFQYKKTGRRILKGNSCYYRKKNAGKTIEKIILHRVDKVTYYI